MNFSEALKNYINILNCSTNDICKESGISYSLVNRYINNKRTPKDEGGNLSKLVDALYNIALIKKVDLTRDSIYKTLKNSLISSNSMINFDLFIDNFNILQDELSITTVELSKAIGYDSSFISRIKNKERKPSDIENFIDKINNYFYFIVSLSDEKRYNVANLFNCLESDLKNDKLFAKKVLCN